MECKWLVDRVLCGLQLCNGSSMHLQYGITKLSMDQLRSYRELDKQPSACTGA